MYIIVLLNYEGNSVASYKALVVNQMYCLKEAYIKVSSKWLKQKSESIYLFTILKGWLFEGHFRTKSATIEWKTSKFRKSVQIIVIFLSRVSQRKDGSTFPEKWISIIYQIITSVETLNWGELISSNLDNQLKKVHKEHQFYMSTYLMNVMCVSLEFPSLGWKWESNFPLIHVFCKMLWEKNIRRVMRWYATNYFWHCIKYFLVKKHRACHLKDKKF